MFNKYEKSFFFKSTKEAVNKISDLKAGLRRVYLLHLQPGFKPGHQAELARSYVLANPDKIPENNPMLYYVDAKGKCLLVEFDDPKKFYLNFTSFKQKYQEKLWEGEVLDCLRLSPKELEILITDNGGHTPETGITACEYTSSEIRFATSAMLHSLHITVPKNTKLFHDVSSFTFMNSILIENTPGFLKATLIEPGQSGKILFSGIVFNANHWVLMELDIRRTEDGAKLILDFKCHNPLTTSTKMDNFSQLSGAWLHEIKQLYKEKLGSYPEIEINNIDENKNLQQFDTCSCGPILCQNLTDILQGKRPEQVCPQGAFELRKRLACMAEEYAGLPCSFPEPEPQELWTPVQQKLWSELQELCKNYHAHCLEQQSLQKAGIINNLLMIIKNDDGKSFDEAMNFFRTALINNKDDLIVHRDNEFVRFFNALWNLIKRIFSPSQEKSPGFWQKTHGHVLYEKLGDMLLTEDFSIKTL